MIIAIVGESASGKSTLVKDVAKTMYDFSEVIAYTTRPKREKEVEGEDYFFIEESRFNEMIATGEFLEHRTYNGWHYGTTVSSFLKPKNYVVALNPAGARELKKYANNHSDFKHKIVIVYLCVDRRSRLINLLQRGDNIDEAYRRNLSDVGQFDSFSNEADYVIHNEEYFFDKYEVCAKLQDIILKERENGKGI